MQTTTVTIPRPHQAQQDIINESTRFNVVNCGRRFGKTQLGINRVVTPESLPYPVGWFSPTYKMLLEVWRDAVDLLAPITKRKSISERRIEFVTGGVLEFWSLDKPDAARGRKYKRIIVDEAAMVPDLMRVWQMVLRSMLADYGGDAWFLSTPKGMNGFWQMYQWGQDSEVDEWACWTIPTSANPFIPDAEIEAMRQTMPERIYRQEILAQFLDDAGGVFRRVLEAAKSAEMDKAEEGKQYVAGVDVATQIDFTVASVFDVAAKRQVYMDRFNRVEYTTLEDRLEALHKRFNLTTMVIESNSIGRPVIDHMRQRGLSIQEFTTTNITKTAIIQKLQAAFEHGEIEILNDPILIGELQAYEGKQMATYWRYGAPEGMHDDCVMSLAITWDAIDNRPQFIPNPFYD